MSELDPIVEKQPRFAPDAIITVCKSESAGDSALATRLGSDAIGFASDGVTRDRRVDHGDGTYQVVRVFIPKGRDYNQPELKLTEEIQKGHPHRMDYEPSGKLQLNFHEAKIEMSEQVDFEVVDRTKPVGTLDNPFILDLDSSSARKQITALSRLIRPYLKAGKKVGVYAVLPSGKESKQKRTDGIPEGEILFIDRDIPTLDIPFAQKEKYYRLTIQGFFFRKKGVEVTISSQHNLIQDTEVQVNKYIHDIVKHYSEFMNMYVSVKVLNSNDFSVNVGAFDREKPDFDQIVKQMMVKNQTNAQLVQEPAPAKTLPEVESNPQRLWQRLLDYLRKKRI